MLAGEPDPQAALQRYIVQLEEQEREATSLLATAMREERRLHGLRGDAQYEASLLEKRALAALKSGDDSLAREALERRVRAEQQADTHQVEWRAQNQRVELLRECLGLLQRRLSEARYRRALLSSRAALVEAQRILGKSQAGEQLEEKAEEGLADLERSLAQVESEAAARQAVARLDTEEQPLSEDARTRVELELARLRKQLEEEK